MKVLTVVGARPQFIKASAVSRRIGEESGIEEGMVHTGQHYDTNMSDQFFEELSIPKPMEHLGVGSASHGAQTGRMLEAIEKTLLSYRPDALLVYGDTNSTLAGALAAVKLRIPVVHVEAGLRSFNRTMPEEINRVMTDHVSEILFTPTSVATDHLLSEGISKDKICQVGDVMFDVARHYGEKARSESQVLERLGLEAGEYLLSTVHRAENTDAPDRLRAIFEGLMELAEKTPVVLPIHPRTRKVLGDQGMWDGVAAKLKLVDPLGYLDMVKVTAGAKAVLTDSGGLQKEAYFHRVPCITLRDETEWVELVEAGWNRIVPPTSVGAIVGAVAEVERPEQVGDLYGDGNAAGKIVSILKERVG